MSSLATFTLAIPKEMARFKSAGGVPDPPCKTSGKETAA